jgi:cytochrome bd-type quinol oxidase subunit 2
MLIVAAIGVLLVAIYKGSVYKTFRGKVKLNEMYY